MKVSNAITCIILIAFSVPVTGYGAVYLSYHDRDLSAWADPDYQTEHHEALNEFNRSISATGTTDTASAEQNSWIQIRYDNTHLAVSGQEYNTPATGEASVSGIGAEAFSQIRVDFVVNDGDMKWCIDYAFTGDDGYIQLCDDWTSCDDPIAFYYTGSGTDAGTLIAGTYTLWVAAYNDGTFQYNDGTFQTIFTVSEADLACTEQAECDDNDECTDDACVDNQCQYSDVNCDDSNECTNDSCDSLTGCVNDCNATGPSDLCCDDPACADAVVCLDCSSDADCDDNQWCNGSETCEDGACIPGENPCLDDENDCTDDSCDEVGDSCEYECNASDSEDPCCDDLACANSSVCGGPSNGGGSESDDGNGGCDCSVAGTSREFNLLQLIVSGLVFLLPAGFTSLKLRLLRRKS